MRYARYLTIAIFILMSIIAGAVVCTADEGTADWQELYGEIQTDSAEAPELYLKFQGDQMWRANSQEALEMARPIVGREFEGRRGSEIEMQVIFPDVVLQEAGEGRPQILGTFQVRKLTKREYAEWKKLDPRGGGLLWGSVIYKIVKRDKAGAEWSYESNDGVMLVEKGELGRRQGRLPKFESIALNIDASYSKQMLGIGLGAMVDGRTISNIRKDGQEVNCRVMILDESGEPIASEEGPLSKFGYG